MDTREIFKKAFSDIQNTNSFPAHEKAYNDVLERAKRMKTQNVIYEAPEKKRSSVLTAAAWIAGSAAVLAGAVFGLKFLADHGGLKGPDVSSGAGYSAASETTSATELITAEPEIKTTEPEQTVTEKIEFENFIGMTEDEARAYLEENNRNFGFIEMDSDEPAGIIFKQEPPAGTLVSSSVTADLYVSKGNLLASYEYDDGSVVSVESYYFDGKNLELAYTVKVPEGSEPGYNPLAVQSPMCVADSAVNGTTMHVGHSGTVDTYSCTFTCEKYADNISMYFLPAYSGEEEYTKVFAEKYKYQFTAAVNTDAVPESDAGILEMQYEGEQALEILKYYAGEDYCFPLENWTKEVINYRTHDAWTGDDTSTDYRFNIPADEGDPILAVTGGTVIETFSLNNYENGGEGIYVTIQAADGRKWRYSHLSDYYVSEGDTVKAGDKIAAVGATGRATGPLVCISFPGSDVIDPAQNR